MWDSPQYCHSGYSPLPGTDNTNNVSDDLWTRTNDILINKEKGPSLYMFSLYLGSYIYGQPLLTIPNLQQSLRNTSICSTMKTVTSLLVCLVVVCLLIAQHTAGKMAATRYSYQYCMLVSNTS